MTLRGRASRFAMPELSTDSDKNEGRRARRKSPASRGGNRNDT